MGAYLFILLALTGIEKPVEKPPFGRDKIFFQETFGLDEFYHEEKLSVGFPPAFISKDLFVIASFGYEKNDIHYEDRLRSFDSELYTNSFSLSTIGRFSKKWSSFFLQSVSFRNNQAHNLYEQKSFSGNSLALLSYDLNRNIRFSLGAIYSLEFGRHKALPAAALRFEGGDSLPWQLRLGFPATHFLLEFQPGFEFGLQVSYDSAMARVGKDSGLYADASFIKRTQIRSAMILHYQLYQYLWLGAEIGVMPYQKLKILNSDQNTIQSSTREPSSVFSSLRLGLRF